MVFQTGISFEKREYHQEEAIRGKPPLIMNYGLNRTGHIDVDIDQYQAPADGRREDYICRFKVYGQFSFQQPDFRKSTIPRWKRGRDATASWQSFVVSLLHLAVLISTGGGNYLRVYHQFQRPSVPPKTWQSYKSSKHSL